MKPVLFNEQHVSRFIMKCLTWNIKNTQNANLPSLHRGPPKVVMLQSQVKPSHCCRHTPWLAHESSWQVVLGPEDGEKPQPREPGFIRRGAACLRRGEMKCHANVLATGFCKTEAITLPKLAAVRSVVCSVFSVKYQRKYADCKSCLD